MDTQRTQFLNEIDRLSREYYYADHINAILGVYTTLDEFTDLQYDYVDQVVKCECFEKELSKKHIKNDKAFNENQSNVFLKEREQYFKIQDLKAQLQDKSIATSELKKLIEKMKGKPVETKFEKPSVIRQSNAFKSQRQSVLGKPTTFSDSLAKKDFSKSKSVTTNKLSNDFSKQVTTQILPQNVKPILKNTNVIAPGMYKVHTQTSQTRTPQLPQDIRKTNKCVSFSTRVIPTTSVSKPPLKSNRMEDRVMPNNSQGKKQEFTPSGYKWKPMSPIGNVNTNVSMPLGNASRTANILEPMAPRCSTMSNTLLSSNSFAARRDNSIHRRIWVLKAHDGKSQASKVYYVEGLNHNLFSVGQLCDADLEVAFRKSTCYVRDLKGNDLLTGSRGTYLYSITLQNSSTSNPICLMAKATSSQDWLWHRCLSHLNFDSINLLSKNDIVIGLL
ncbi:retrovirus-related pol polyprotein from transposon TNT 1-94 [Tanacetum coccineum]